MQVRYRAALRPEFRGVPMHAGSQEDNASAPSRATLRHVCTETIHFLSWRRHALLLPYLSISPQLSVCFTDVPNGWRACYVHLP